MPPKSANTRGTKRPLEDADANAGPAKKSTAAKSTKGAMGPPPVPSASTGTAPAPPPIRIPRGPNGETFLPSIMPVETKDTIDKVPIPRFWVRGFDGTPGREMTLGDREWWETHGPWLEKNKKGLRLTAAHFKMRDEAMRKVLEPEPDRAREDWDFFCVMSPKGGDSDDEGDDENEEEEEEEAAEPDPKTKVAGKLASLHPDHVWCFSMLGFDRSQWWKQEVAKRDQDEFGLYVNNDFSWYGCLEALENMMWHVSKLVTENADYRKFWPEVEGLALLLFDDPTFTMADDGERCGEMVELIGAMTVSALCMLKKQGVLKPGSEIRNLGLVLALIFKWGYGHYRDCYEDEADWVHRVADMADEARIDLADAKLTGVPGMGKWLEALRAEEREESDCSKWDAKTFSRLLKEYRREHGTGGTYHDLTKWSAAQKKEYSFEGMGRHFF